MSGEPPTPREPQIIGLQVGRHQWPIHGPFPARFRRVSGT